MLQTNLSTRPFYNERLVHALLAVVGLLVAVVTAYNLSQVFVLSGLQAQMRARVTEFGDKAARLRDQAAGVRRSINGRELDAALSAAREANAIIERRAFSWTELFNHFEATLPDNVRIAAVRPRVDRDGVMTVTVSVVARNVEGIDTFIENLEKLKAFTGLLSREEFVNDDGLLQAAIEGRYEPAPLRAAPEATR
jgi:Tfp pilus assembly protein PilN